MFACFSGHGGELGEEREADNFWHESHKTLRGEQIINSNSTKKMAAAAATSTIDDGDDDDAVATNSPFRLLSHSENMYIRIRRSRRKRERSLSLSLSLSAVENVIVCENLQINSGGWTKNSDTWIGGAGRLDFHGSHMLGHW